MTKQRTKANLDPKMISLQTGEGYFVEGSGPGVLILPAWWGLKDSFKGVCSQLSQAGFSALALDLYHGRSADTIEDAKRLRQSLDRTVTNQEIKLAVAFLRERHENKIGILGFSLGAHLALWAMDNCANDVCATVLFYGTSGGRFRRTKSPVLGHFVEHDPYEGREKVSALRSRLEAQKIPHTFHFYEGTHHWFMEEDRPEYEPTCASVAWKRTLDFLHQAF